MMFIEVTEALQYLIEYSNLDERIKFIFFKELKKDQLMRCLDSIKLQEAFGQFIYTNIKEMQSEINHLNKQLSIFEAQRTQMLKDISEANDLAKSESLHNTYNTLIKKISDIQTLINQEDVLYKEHMIQWTNAQKQQHKQEMDDLHKQLTETIKQQKKGIYNERALMQQQQLEQMLPQQPQKLQQQSNQQDDDKNIFED